MKPRISVITPVYNVKPYLQEAIDSILLQKEFLHEIIIVDDGSNDGSAELLDKLYGNSDFIKIIHKENEGQGVARNRGTKVASGDFIYYFDSDDIVEPYLFRDFCDLALKYPDIDIFCFSGVTFLDSNYKISSVSNKNILASNAYSRPYQMTCSNGEEAFLRLYPVKSFFAGPPFYLFRRNLLEKNNIAFKQIRYEDEEFTIKLFLHSGKVVITDKVFYKRRIREGSTMQLKRNFKDILGYIKTIESLESLISLSCFKNDTKKMLYEKIKVLIRAIITMKTRSEPVLSPDEKKIYNQIVKRYVFSDKDLFIFYCKLPLKLRYQKIKESLSRNSD